MKKYLGIAAALFAFHSFANPDRAAEYRQLSLGVLKQAQFKVYLPGDTELPFSYQYTVARAMSEKPQIVKLASPTDSEKHSYVFLDRLLLAPGSKLISGRQSFDLSCVRVRGTDKRQNPSPRIPDLYLEIHIVPNDPNCEGPVDNNDLFEPERWPTVIHYFVKDLQNFTPEKVTLRYRKNSFAADFLP